MLQLYLANTDLEEDHGKLQGVSTSPSSQLWLTSRKPLTPSTGHVTLQFYNIMDYQRLQSVLSKDKYSTRAQTNFLTH